jgi:deazaflavin-dependent oxidoreductase (nitroreductase family)
MNEQRPTMTQLVERLANVANRSTLRLTHYGRKTGKPYTVTIWFVVDGERVYLPTLNTGRQWPRNVQANPQARLEIGDEGFAGRITRVTDSRELLHVYELLAGKYWIPWILDHVAAVLGRDPRKTGLDMGSRGFFRVQFEE